MLNSDFRVLMKDFLQGYFRYSKNKEAIPDNKNSLLSSEEDFECHVMLEKDIELKDFLNGINRKLKDLTGSQSQTMNLNLYGGHHSVQLDRKDLLFFEIRDETLDQNTLNKIVEKYTTHLDLFVKNSVFKIQKVKVIVVCQDSGKIEWIVSKSISFLTGDGIQCEIIGFVEFDTNAFQEILQTQNTQASQLLKEATKGRR